MFIDDFFVRAKEELAMLGEEKPRNFDHMFDLYNRSVAKVMVVNPEMAKSLLGIHMLDGEIRFSPGCLTSGMMLWNSSGRQIYKIAEQFGKCLSDVPLDFKVKDLHGKDVLGLIQLPASVELVSKKGSTYPCVLAAVLPTGISFLFMEYQNGEYIGAADYYFFRWDREDLPNLMDMTFGEVFDNDHSEKMPKSGSDLSRENIEYAIKCLMYISSASPDLTEYKPLPTDKSVGKRERDRNRNLNVHGSLPATLVGFTWMKPVAYNVDSTLVTGHFRWQRCGVALSQVKLVYIHEHTRQFKTES